MKQYTIIYAEFFQSGNHQNSITKLQHIRCKPEDLKNRVEKFADFGNVWFILDGYCKQNKN